MPFSSYLLKAQKLAIKTIRIMKTPWPVIIIKKKEKENKARLYWQPIDILSFTLLYLIILGRYTSDIGASPAAWVHLSRSSLFFFRVRGRTGHDPPALPRPFPLSIFIIIIIRAHHRSAGA